MFLFVFCHTILFSETPHHCTLETVSGMPGVYAVEHQRPADQHRQEGGRDRHGVSGDGDQPLPLRREERLPLVERLLKLHRCRSQALPAGRDRLPPRRWPSDSKLQVCYLPVCLGPLLQDGAHKRAGPVLGFMWPSKIIRSLFGSMDLQFVG